MEGFASHSTERLKEKVAEGLDGKINGYNLDTYVTTNEIRLDNKNKDLQFFASDFTFDRIYTKNLDIQNL